MYENKVVEVEQLIESQNRWRDTCINLIASENVVSQRARAQAGSDFAHRYAEGHPGERYYRGTTYIDEIENQLKTNLKIMFECDHSEVRPISGTNANEAVFSRLLCPGDVVMVNSTPAGGHISHHKEGSLGKFTKNIIDIPLTADGYHNDIILNMNMLPHEPLRKHDRPDGIRIGTQEMTRIGMGEQEMGRIAELMKECIIDKKAVKDEVNRFRSKFQHVHYSYDPIKAEKPQPVKLKELQN
jgi:glycine/serine hydroxymethyltransferase